MLSDLRILLYPLLFASLWLLKGGVRPIHTLTVTPPLTVPSCWVRYRYLARLTHLLSSDTSVE